MPRPLKWGTEMVNTKIKLPKDLKERAKSDGINFSDFLAVKLYEYYNIDYKSLISKDEDQKILKILKKNIDDKKNS